MTDRVEDAVAWALLACALFVVAVVGTGVIEAGVGLTAGAEVPVWVDPSGAVVPAPVSPDDAQWAGLLACVAVVAAGRRRARRALVGVVRRATATRNADIGEQEWAQVGPAWRRDDDAR